MGKTILWVILGIISIAGGILALASPLVATFVATTIAAWVFIFVGVAQVIGAFSAEGAWAKIGNILLGALAVFLGFSILQNPLAGALALTTLVGILFLASGVFKLVLAFSVEERRAFWLILISGALSVLLAILIFSNFPYSAATMLGILLGVDLISNGVSLIAMSLALRKLERSA
jgi:uncharacterized membrane protein HdeD (DUF308 family)